MSAVRVAILSVGDELVLGQIEDTNASWMARALREIGAMPGERRTIGDDRAALARALRELAASHGAVIITGGLGPTLDDLTREALCDVLDGDDVALVEDPAGVAHLARWFAARGRPGSTSFAIFPPPSRNYPRLSKPNPSSCFAPAASAAKSPPPCCAPRALTRCSTCKAAS